jgi:hypothetical protein
MRILGLFHVTVSRRDEAWEAFRAGRRVGRILAEVAIFVDSGS